MPCMHKTWRYGGPSTPQLHVLSDGGGEFLQVWSSGCLEEAADSSCLCPLGLAVMLGLFAVVLPRSSAGCTRPSGVRMHGRVKSLCR